MNMAESPITRLKTGSSRLVRTTVRTFASPALELGKDFEYTLKAELVRDGQKLVANKTVLVRAGQETRVAIDFATTSVASK